VQKTELKQTNKIGVMVFGNQEGGGRGEKEELQKGLKRECVVHGRKRREKKQVWDFLLDLGLPRRDPGLRIGIVQTTI